MPITTEPKEPQVAHQAAWVVGCRVVGIGCTIVSNFLIARLLGPDGFGVFLLTTTVLGFGCLLALGGLSDAGLRFISENLGLRRFGHARLYMKTVMGWASVSSILATALVVFGLLVFKNLTNNNEITFFVILLVGLGVLLLAWQQLSAQILRGLNDLRSASFYSGGQTGGPLSNLLFTIPLFLALFFSVSLSTTNVVSLLVGSICLTLPFALLGVYRASRKLLGSAHAEQYITPVLLDTNELVGVAASLLGIQLLAFITVQADMWIGSCLLTPRDFGFYGAAKRGQLIAHMPLQMALMTIQATIPRLHAQRRFVELEQVLRSAITWASVIAMPALLLFVAFPTEVLTLCFGEAFAGASHIVLPLAVGLLALLFFGSPADVLSITGNHNIVLKVNVVSAVALVVFGLVGAYFAGALGLAIGSSAATILQNVILWCIARRRLGIWTHLGRLIIPKWNDTDALVAEPLHCVDGSATSDGTVS